MKKMILLIAVLLGAVTAQSQITKDNLLIGGSLTNLKLDFDKQTSFELTPKVAWFVKDGLAVGGYAHFGLEHTHGADGSLYKYGAGPFARYYGVSDKLPVFGKAKFFLEANVGFEGTDNTVISKNTNGLGFGVGPGVSYFITPTVGLEALLKYNGTVGFGSDTYANGLSFGIGFNVYLPSKKVRSEAKEIMKSIRK